MPSIPKMKFCPTNWLLSPTVISIVTPVPPPEEVSNFLGTPKGHWEWVVSYNYAHLKFDNYILGDQNLSGKYLPGVPLTIQYCSAIQFFQGLGSAFQIQYSGNLYADDANQTLVDDYLLANIRFWKSYDNLSFFGGINNLLDTAYFDNIRINAFGKRYYEPAPMRNFYLGMSINF